MPATFHVGDTREVVASLPTGSVDLILTSPPFLALRSYLPADHPDKANEIGSEPDPASFIDVMLGLSAEWRRVLAPHGSLAVEFGDTYSGSGGGGGDYSDGGMRDGQPKFDGSGQRIRATRREGYIADGVEPPARRTLTDAWPLPKSLTLVPELYRVALAYGRHPLTGAESPAGRWRVRNVVRWVRPNPPVGALGDKFRPATSDLVIACTAADRWFDLDAVRTEHKHGEAKAQGTYGHGPKGNRRAGGDDKYGDDTRSIDLNPAGAPPLDWWQIVPKGYEGAHFATFPAELCVKPIEAMCPRRVCRTCGKPSRREVEQTPEYRATRDALNAGDEQAGTAWDAAVGKRSRGFGSGGGAASLLSNGHITAATTTTGWTSCGCPGTDGIRLDGFHTGTGWRPGIVLDPFVGSGTTLAVATGHGRDAIGIDLDARNVDLARERLGMFLDVA